MPRLGLRESCRVHCFRVPGRRWFATGFRAKSAGGSAWRGRQEIEETCCDAELRLRELLRPSPEVRYDEAVASMRERLTEALQGRDDVRLALLFGSFARGRHTAESDVDVAVLAPRTDLFALAARLSLALEHEVDVVSLDSLGLPLLAAILRDGVIVHEAARGIGAAWRARALTILETDRPWWERMRAAQARRLVARL